LGSQDKSFSILEVSVKKLINRRGKSFLALGSSFDGSKERKSKSVTLFPVAKIAVSIKPLKVTAFLPEQL
jgi:hypothetical protein